MELEGLKSGVIIEDPFFPEPVKIIQVQPLENGAIQIQGVGTVERKFYDPVLSPEDLAKLKLFTDLDLLEESVHKKENPLCLRRLKEDLKDFSGKPLFPPRKVFTPRFELNLGYDIRSEDDQGNVRYIEVKARACTGAITLTANEWFMARCCRTNTGSTSWKTLEVRIPSFTPSRTQPPASNPRKLSVW